MIDLHNFNRVSDKHGRLVGSTVLADLAHILRQHCRKEDLLFHWGREEFALLLPDTDLSDAKTMSERIRTAVSLRDFPHAGRLTAGFGVSVMNYARNKFMLKSV